MTKLTEKQTEILEVLANNYDLAGVALSNYHVTYSVPNALVEKGYARKVTHNGAIYYEITEAGRAAIAQPVSVATDAAPAWTPAVGERVRIKADAQLSGDNRDVDAIQGMGVIGKIIRRGTETGYDWVVSFGLDGDYSAATDELEPAPDAAQTAAADAVTVADKPPFAPSETDYANAMKIIDQQAEQIAALTRERDAAKAKAVDATDDLQQYRGWINDLIDGLDHISPIEALTRLLAFRRTYETDRARFADDAAPMIAALVAARQRADDGARLTTADVIAQSEFAPED